MSPQGVDNSTFTGTYAITQTDIDNGGVYNLATATGQDPKGEDVTATSKDPNPLEPNDPHIDPNCPDCTYTPLTPTPSITLLKSGSYVDANSDGVVNVGDAIHYTFTVTNTGNVTVSNIVVTDPLVTVVGGPITLSPQGVDNSTFTATYTITQVDINAGHFVNTALVTGNDPKGNEVSDNGTADTPLRQNPSIDLTKSGEYVDANGDGFVNLGDAIHYTFTVTNTGNVSLTNIIVTDPKVTVIGAAINLEPGEIDSTTFTGTYAITEADLQLGGVYNLATATGKDPKDNPVTDDSRDPNPLEPGDPHIDPNCPDCTYTPTPHSIIDAVNDTYGPINGVIGGITASVLDNDSLQHHVVNPATIVLTPGAPSSPVLTMNPDGTITIAPGTPVGIYTYPYTICEKLNPSNCDAAVATITVTHPKDTIVDSLCTTCIDVVCLDNPFGENSVITTTLCDGSTTISGTVIDATVDDNGCVVIKTKEIVGRDTICVIQCDKISGLCDTTVIVVVTPPNLDEIIDTLPTGTHKTVCVEVEPDMNPANTIYTFCDGSTESYTSSLGFVELDANGCVTYTAGNTVGNEMPICVVACDTILGMCDTTIIKFTIIPHVDVIKDTNYINTNTTVCVPIENGFGSSVTTAIIDCGYANNSGNTYAVLSVNPPCLLVVRSSTLGYDLDTVCVVTCNEIGMCDTTRIIVSNIVKHDVILDTLPIKTTTTICDYLPKESNITVTNCDRETTTGTTQHGGTWTINPQTKCLEYTAGSLKTNDTLCLTICDNASKVCKEDTIIITVTGLPPIAVRDDVLTDPNTPVTIPVLVNDIQTDEDPLKLCSDGAIVIRPANGTVIVDHNSGTITYTPNPGFSGIDSFVYQICDPEGSDTAIVYIKVSECELPTVITPNGDGINDRFELPCPALSPISFFVFNRWGIEVFRSESYGASSNYFDGTYKGSPLPDGTYYYVIKYTNVHNEQVNKANYLTIHR